MMALAMKTEASAHKLLCGEAVCDDATVRKLSAMSAILELACRRPDLRDELLRPFVEESDPDIGNAEPCNQLDEKLSETKLSNGPWDRLPSVFRPPPGLEDVVPMTAIRKQLPHLGHSLEAAHDMR